MEEQLFFILIILGLLGGYTLAHDKIIAKFEVLSQVHFKENRQLNLALTISLILIGLLTLCFPGNGQSFFIGDMLPAFAVILMAKILAYKLFMTKVHKDEEIIEDVHAPSKGFFTKVEIMFERLFVNNQEIIGLVAIVIILLHFFVPSVIFL